MNVDNPNRKKYTKSALFYGRQCPHIHLISIFKPKPHSLNFSLSPYNFNA